MRPVGVLRLAAAEDSPIHIVGEQTIYIHAVLLQCGLIKTGFTYIFKRSLHFDSHFPVNDDPSDCSESPASFFEVHKNADQTPTYHTCLPMRSTPPVHVS
jgi:hypothetical protein